ncbi:MAG: transcription antitermination factor NusB [Clostridia bacterium]|jgi:N utilization substance protein B|nr:transcription antitermination factor NusB [Clostridia bacterium]MBQ3652195.1 transcription antitermination factor NusB [Clostridia bacterium]MBQ6357858.1 transcription antitermination factor NusB [Clostridia bacterium]MBQ9924118.1 transcription antitermination factor NusB [Clostridia bacterium]MBR0422520.1 transcription antitermination factor NusB [Clostridia bacterium]
MDRSLAREIGMKMLYAASLGGGETMDQVLEQSEQADTLSGADKTFLENLVAGVTDRQQELDEIIGRYAQGWALNRLAKVDLTILRMAVYELLHMPEVPVGATINEAVELSKRFCEDKSSGFINGILGSVARDLCSE